MDTLRNLNKLNEILEAMNGGALATHQQRLLAYGTIKTLIEELRWKNKEDYNGNPYAFEKLTELQNHMGALIGLEDDAGVSESQLFVWAQKALKALGSEHCFGEWK